ncbi:MAG: hypothetical protein WC223_10925 [Bacteroidales bacterium]|jgi:hypothetical protein
MFNKKISGLYYSVILLLIFLFLDSCKSVYIPNAINAPFLTEKKQGQAAFSYGTSNLDGQAAYSFADNFAAMANFSFWHLYKIKQRYHDHRFFEGGAGYYNKINKSWLFDAYSCLGFGSTDIHIRGAELSMVDGKYFRAFLQPSIGLVTETFEGGFSLRMCYVNFLKFSVSNSDFKNPASYYLEPVLTGKVGTDKLKFFAQIGISVPMGNKAFNTDYDYQNFIFNLGISYKIFYPPKRAGRSVRYHRDYLGL